MKISKVIRNKSTSDKKEYKIVKLSNGLKVLLVKQVDDRKDKVSSKLKRNLAAVALCVGSGCFHDPKNVQGMSHFLEHMIFMGSEKYPKENDFEQYVSSHGGFDNAYTECEYTLFHFDIIEKHLAGALDRFAQFFISPLMSVESMEREMNVIESEFQSNSMDDEVRISQIFCSLIHDTNPASNFVWGNLKTLRDGIDKKLLHEKLHDFCKANYMANRMFLCIQSSVDINRLERTVTKYFAEIPGELESFTTLSTDEVFKPNFHKKIFFVKSTSEKCKLLMTFLLPSVKKEIKFLEYLASLFQYEGSGSLSDLFMTESLAFKVNARVGSQSFEGNSLFTFFTIEVNLRSKGFKDFDKVLEAIFAFLLLLKTTSMSEHRRGYNEFKEIKDMLFKYRKEKPSIDNVQELAVNMKYFSDEDVIIGKEIVPDFNEGLMKTMIDKLNEKRFNLLILSDQYLRYDKVEKWFGTEYAEIDFPQAYTKLWNERWLRKELFLPKPNEYICKNFEIFKNPSEIISPINPIKIISTSTFECFYKLDNSFDLPHGFIYVFFISAVTKSSVSFLNLTSIFSMCVKNFLSEQLYSAKIAGYNYKLTSVDDGLVLRLNGFNEKLPLIIHIITKRMKNLKELIDKSVFEMFRKELKKNFRNCLNDGNLMNDDCRLSIIKQHHRSYIDRLQNVDSLTYENFREFCAIFIPSLRFNVLIQGNLPESSAHDISKRIMTNLILQESKVMSSENFLQITKIPIGSSYLKINARRRNDMNSVLKNYYQIGKSTIRGDCITEIIVSMIYQPLFDTLRTHEQLGYGIACTFRKNWDVLGITITIEYQENQKSAELIDSKIEEFLMNFFESLKAKSDEEFSSVRRAIISMKLIDDTDLEKEVNRNWNEIRNGEKCFDRNVLEAFEIKKVTKVDILDFYYKTFLSVDDVRKLSVQVVGCQSAIEDSECQERYEVKVQDKHFAQDLIQFKKNLEAF